MQELVDAICNHLTDAEITARAVAFGECLEIRSKDRPTIYADLIDGKAIVLNTNDFAVELADPNSLQELEIEVRRQMTKG